MELENLETQILKGSFRSRHTFNTANKLIQHIVKKNKVKENEDGKNVDLGSILHLNNLRLVKNGFIFGKKNVLRVTNKSGQTMILKIGRIEPFQVRLFRLAKIMEKKLCFRVPLILSSEKNWFLMEEIKGEELNNLYEDEPDRAMALNEKIADDYQKILARLCAEDNVNSSIAKKEKFLFSALNYWSKPIVDAGLIDFSVVQEIKNDFESRIADQGNSFFGWFHGNIIGDHVLIKDDKPYLLDLAINARPGNGYYDLLRAMDFYFLKARDTELAYRRILGWLDQYFGKFDQEEVRLVFALRNIGIVGCDILMHDCAYIKGKEEKIKFALKFIKREY